MKPGDLVAWDSQGTHTGVVVSVYRGTHNPLVGEELMAEVMWLSGEGQGQVADAPACFLYLLSEGNNEEGK